MKKRRSVPASASQSKKPHLLSTALCAQLACIWEATARKPGNVHRYCDFDDLSYLDFLTSAAAMAPILEIAWQRPVGATILAAIQATRCVASTNTNLGIVLLLAPLAAVKRSVPLASGLKRVLDTLDNRDARSVYRAIRLAAPGGLGTVAEQDVRAEPTKTLGEVMALAAKHDLIALQYVNGFRQVLREGVPVLRDMLRRKSCLEEAIIACHLHLLAEHPDSLIARKRGLPEAERASLGARQVLAKGWPNKVAGRMALTKLDDWLRAKGHARNPGTTADLVTACLFVLLREGNIVAPSRFAWSNGWQHG